MVEKLVLNKTTNLIINSDRPLVMNRTYLDFNMYRYMAKSYTAK